MTTAIKPLGHRAYGHIGHLPGSRLGPGDHKVHDGQGMICTERARDRHDRIIVQEKLDGTNVAAVLLDGQVVALIRAGYTAQQSHYRQHQLFAAFVRENEERFRAVLREGERLCGEWLVQAHGTRYALPHEPFVAFDLMRGQIRTPFDGFRQRVEGTFTAPRLISDGPPFSIADALAAISISGHGALDPVEGAVWRVERKGAVDFLAKYVRHDKRDGCYLPERGTTGGEVWNDTPWKP